MSLDGYLVKRQYRKAALRFFCEFIQSQPPRLHEIQQTPLLNNLLKCLLYDTSTVIASAALTALVMLLPHMPGSLVPYLPTLFNIYARMLFWDKERAGSIESPSETTADHHSDWEVCPHIPDVEDFSIPQLSNYYTILYGLYPINFMDYIRKPQRYLRHANASGADDVQMQPTEIRHESEKFRRRHLLHPNFYTFTIESEKTDMARWIKTEAPEVVAECMSLCYSSESSIPLEGVGSFSQWPPPPPPPPPPQGMREDSDRNEPDVGLLSSSLFQAGSWQASPMMRTDFLASNAYLSNTITRHLSSKISAELESKDDVITTESPTLASQLSDSSSHTHLRDLFQSSKAIKPSLTQSLASGSVPSLALSHQESVGERPPGSSGHHQSTSSASASATNINSQIAHLQRQMMLLQNDLSFERYLKQQHMAHIGDLRRRKVAEAATEAETQNLILMSRNLKSRYEEAKKAEMQVRKESEKSRAMAKKWEADLASKLKNLREESKKTSAELSTTRRDLEDSIAEREKLKKLVCNAEGEELTWKQNMQSIKIHAAEVDRLKAEVNRLTITERDYQAAELEREKRVNAVTAAESRVEALRLMVVARENEARRTSELFESQIAELKNRLSSLQEEREQSNTKTIVVVEEALAASRAKHSEMQAQLSLLQRKYTKLQSSLLDMQSEVPQPELTGATRQHSNAPAPIDIDTQSSSGPAAARSRIDQELSDPTNGEVPPQGTASLTELRRINTMPPQAIKPKAQQQEQRQGDENYQEPHPGTPVDVSNPQSMMVPMSSDRVLGRAEVTTSIWASNAPHSPSGGTQGWSRKDSRDRHKEDAGGLSSGVGPSSGSRKEKKSSGFRSIRSFGS